MKAIVSGQLSMAVLLERGAPTSLLEEPAIQNRSIDVAMDLMHEATDTAIVSVEDAKGIHGELERAWRKDRGLHLMLILLDATLSHATRASSAEALTELWDPEIASVVTNRLYSAPLPQSADYIGALALLGECQAEGALADLQEVVNNQGAIVERVSAWDALPYELFGGPSEKMLFKRDAIEAGAFRVFVTESRGNLALYKLLVHEQFRGNAQARRVLQRWAAPFRETVSSAEFQETVDDHEVPDRRRRRRTSVPAHVALDRVTRQKDTIKALLQQGDTELALRYTRQLVESQRLDEGEHVAKSLCDLSQFAKQLGATELQCHFAEWATREAPHDAWSFAQLGDALRASGDYEKALEAYHRAEVLGEARVALVGRGQILKDLGQLREALEIFDACAKQFSDDLVPRNARASALADFGHLAEALQEYDKLLAGHAYDVVTRSGRAQVLRELGRYDEAINELDTIVRDYPDEVVPANIRASALKEKGNLEAALAAFRDIAREYPLDPISRNGVASVLRLQGRYQEALDEFRGIIAAFPYHPGAYFGLAETHKRNGQLAEALTEYEALIGRFRAFPSAKIGKAAVLAALERYEEALDLLPNYLPATKTDWAAYHVRGMIHLRMGSIETAESIFERGASDAPWVEEQRFFATGLAAVRIRRRRFAEALTLLLRPVPADLAVLVRVLTIHAYGALGDRERVRAVLSESWESAPRPLLRIKDQLASRYLVAAPADTGASESELFDEESESLLLAA